VVGTAAELGCDRLAAERVNWTGDVPPPPGSRVQCKIRYKAQAVDCILYPQGNDRAEVRFSEPLRDVTPGQGAVFYEGDHCLGGGIIARQPEALAAELAGDLAGQGHRREP
jgi:tRNA-specific 2-thiouridylase